MKLRSNLIGWSALFVSAAVLFVPNVIAPRADAEDDVIDPPPAGCQTTAVK